MRVDFGEAWPTNKFGKKKLASSKKNNFASESYFSQFLKPNMKFLLSVLQTIELFLSLSRKEKSFYIKKFYNCGKG